MALLLLFAPALAAAQATAQSQSDKQHTKKHDDRHEIDLLEATWRDAVLKSNVAVMETLLADDYIAISAAGTLETKEQSLANMRNGRVHFTALNLSDRKVRFYGSTALVTSRADVRGRTTEGDVSGSYRYTRVYAWDKRSAWKIVSFEVSLLRLRREHK